MVLVGEYGFGIAVKVIFDLALPAKVDDDGDTGLNSCDETIVDPPETAKLEGLAIVTIEGIWDLLTEIATELFGIETAALRTRDGIPFNGETDLPELGFDFNSVGDSVVGTADEDNGEIVVVVVGVVGDDKELKNAARAALFWLEITVDDFSSFSDFVPELLLWLETLDANLVDLSDLLVQSCFWPEQSADFSDFSNLALEPALCFEACDVELTGNTAGSDLKSTDL